MHRTSAVVRHRVALRAASAAWFAVASWAGAVVFVLLPGCASVLGVDKTYELAEAGTGQDAGGDAGVPGTIRCATGSPCQAGSEECCLSSQGTLSCASTASSDPCPQGTDIGCDDPSDCPGTPCCIALNASQYLLDTHCASSCAASEIELCAPQGGACSQGTCTALTVLNPALTPPWFYGCQ